MDDDLVIDLRDTSAIERAVGGLQAVHALVNNAAVRGTSPITEVDEEALDNLFAVNLRAPITLMRALHKALDRVGGSVTNVASVHAFATSVGAAPYAAAK